MVNEKAQSFFDQGLALLNKEDFKNAEKKFSEAIILDSDFADAYYYRGLVFFNEGEFYDAFDDLLTAIELDTGFQSKPYEHPVFQGLIHETKFEFNQAIEIYNGILKEEPELAIAHYRQGFCYYCLEDNTNAIKWYTSAINLYKDNSTFYFNRAIAFEDIATKQENEISAEQFNDYFLKAIDDYNTAIKLEPDDAEPVNNRGLLYFYLGEFEKAIDDLTVSIEADFSRAVAYDFRGCAYRELGDFEKAVNDHTKAIDLDSSDPIIFYNRALALIEKGELENAKNDLQKVLKLAPGYEDARKKLNDITKG